MLAIPSASSRLRVRSSEMRSRPVASVCANSVTSLFTCHPSSTRTFTSRARWSGALHELHEMFARPEVRAVLCARGGYGCNYLLPHLDADLIRANPKIFVGYSDATWLLAWLIGSWAGGVSRPNGGEGLRTGRRRSSRFLARCGLRRAVLARVRPGLIGQATGRGRGQRSALRRMPFDSGCVARHALRVGD